MRPYLRFEKEPRKIVFLHVVFFLGVKHPLKNCTNGNRVIIYQKFFKRRQTFSSKDIFLALNFSMSARQTAENAAMFTFVKHPLKNCTN